MYDLNNDLEKYYCTKIRDKQNFISDLNVSEFSVDYVLKWLCSNKQFVDIKKVNKKGHDIEFSYKNKKYFIEVKRDFWTDDSSYKKGTDNICIELWSNFNKGNLGWVYYTDSNYIFYLSNKNLYIINTKKLTSFVDVHIEKGIPNIMEPSIKTDLVAEIKDANKNGNCNVRNLLVNKNILINLNIIEKIIPKDNINKIIQN